MAKHIDAVALIKKIFPCDVVDKQGYAINAKAVYEAILKAPAADVVPRSVIAEIFEEIEKETKAHGICYTQRKIAELRKKYMKGEL